MTFDELKNHIEIVDRYGVEALNVSTYYLKELIADVEDKLQHLMDLNASTEGDIYVMADHEGDYTDEDPDYLAHQELVQGPFDFYMG